MSAPLAGSLMQPVISSVVKGIKEEELEEQENDTWIKNFSSTPSFKQYRDYEPRFNALFQKTIYLE